MIIDENLINFSPEQENIKSWNICGDILKLLFRRVGRTTNKAQIISNVKNSETYKLVQKAKIASRAVGLDSAGSGSSRVVNFLTCQ